jgi:hypothetical protein
MDDILDSVLYDSSAYFSELANKYFLEIQAISDLFLEEKITLYRNNMLIAIDDAYNAITRYLHFIEAYNGAYRSATIKLAIVYYNLPKGNAVITQKTQGGRSQTISTTNSGLDGNSLTAEVKSILPLPKLRII